MVTESTEGKPDRLQYLRDDCAELVEYLAQLEGMVLSSRAGSREGGKPGKVSGSPAPWNAEVAHLITDVHAGARRLEGCLRAAAFGRAPVRGGSDGNTAAALAAIPDLAVHVADGVGSELPSHVARLVNGWCRSSRRLLDRQRAGEKPWTRAPGGLRCPNPSGQLDEKGQPVRDEDGGVVCCDRPLWLAPDWQHKTEPPVFCRHCRTAEGELYSWPGTAWTLAVVQST